MDGGMTTLGATTDAALVLGSALAIVAALLVRGEYEARRARRRPSNLVELHPRARRSAHRNPGARHATGHPSGGGGPPECAAPRSLREEK